MSTTDETAANEAVKVALQALQRARELCERAGYGSLVMPSLDSALTEMQYALDTVLGRN